MTIDIDPRYNVWDNGYVPKKKDKLEEEIERGKLKNGRKSKMDKEEYEWRKELVELEKQSKMEHAKFVRETERLKHEWNLEEGRIKSAEIRKTQMRKQEGGFKF